MKNTEKRIRFTILFLVIAQGIAFAGIENMFSKYNVVSPLLEYYSESEGPVVSGQFNLHNTSQIGKNITLAKEEQILMAVSIVNAGGNTLHVDKGSVTLLDDPNGINLNFNGGGTLETGLTPYANTMFDNTGYNSMSDLMDAFKDYSYFLDAQANGGSVNTSDPNQFVFSATPGQTYTFIDFDGGQLSNAHGIKINLFDNQAVVINVTGSNFTVHANSLTSNPDVIWNFLGTDITFTGGRFGGSVFAPNGIVYLEHGATGLVVGEQVTSKDEFHFNAITAPAFNQVPEPGIAALLAFGALMALRRRK